MNQKTIAEIAGVSAATVSNVINGNYNKVSEETRHRVEEIIRQNNFRPAGGPRLKSSCRTIGLVLPFVGREPTFMLNHFGAYSLAVLDNLAGENNCRLILSTGRSPQEVLSMMSDEILDGVIVEGAFLDYAMELNTGLGIPAVFVDTYTDDPDMVTVNSDDYRGGFLMARYLIARGHKKIAMASPDYSEGVIHERVRGFCDACRESGVPFDTSDIFLTDTKYNSGLNVGQDIALSGKGYTAISSLSDDMAFWMSAGIRQCGMKIPDDLSMIGYDGIPEGTCFMPRLTSVDQNLFLKIETAGNYLLRMMDGETINAHDMLPVQIREGDSVKTLK